MCSRFLGTITGTSLLRMVIARAIVVPETRVFQLEGLGRWLILLGLGIVLFVLGKAPFLNSLGNLPGDIRYQSADGRLSCWIPVVSSIVLSIILTVVLNLIVRVLNR
jgi:hypothetical protein